MKKTIFILAFSLQHLAFAQFLSTADGLAQLTTGPSAASQTCTLFAQLGSGYNSQLSGENGTPSVALTPTTTISLCKVTWGVGANIYSTSSHIEVRTAANGGGTLLATNSSPLTPAPWTGETYTFATPLVVTGGTTVYVTRVASDGRDSLILENEAAQSGFTAVSYFITSALTILAPGTAWSVQIYSMK
jgi:hypothetical protein